MKREELPELHYIAPIRNVCSILAHGILSHNRAKNLNHVSVAMEEIQERRRGVRVPGSGRSLHDYVNLYFHARNPMMFKRRSVSRALCVLRVNTNVLDLPGVVVTDCNASSGYARFAQAPRGLTIIDYQLVFARDWTHADPIEYMRRKSAKCAEVLVPDRVGPEFICGAYVSCDQSRELLCTTLGCSTPGIAVVIDGDLFFE